MLMNYLWAGCELYEHVCCSKIFNEQLTLTNVTVPDYGNALCSGTVMFASGDLGHVKAFSLPGARMGTSLTRTITNELYLLILELLASDSIWIGEQSHSNLNASKTLYTTSTENRE